MNEGSTAEGKRNVIFKARYTCVLAECRCPESRCAALQERGPHSRGRGSSSGSPWSHGATILPARWLYQVAAEAQVEEKTMEVSELSFSLVPGHLPLQEGSVLPQAPRGSPGLSAIGPSCPALLLPTEGKSHPSSGLQASHPRSGKHQRTVMGKDVGRGL